MFKMYFRNKVVFLSGLMLLVSLSVQANPVCNTIAECQALGIEEDADLRELQAAQAVGFLGLETIAYNKISYGDAVAYCTSLGGRLPTAREWARYAESLGAMRYTGYHDDHPYFFYRTHLRSNSRERDYFWFRSWGYRRPSGVMGINMFWSQSVHAEVTGRYFFFHGIDGVIWSYDMAIGAVRCVSGR